MKQLFIPTNIYFTTDNNVSWGKKYYITFEQHTLNTKGDINLRSIT